MKIVSEIDIHIDTDSALSKVRSDALWTFAATEWHRLYTPYVPYASGALADTVAISPGEIEHTVPYAHRLYEGDGFHFRRDQHPLASAHWDRAAAPSQKPKLIQSVQNYVDRGELNLGR